MFTDNSLPIPILTYHQIGPAAPKGSPFRSLSVDPKDFARQMAWLKLLGYQGLSMSALMPYLTGESKGRVFGITFDDGYSNNLANALPILQKYGFSSTCYVVSQLVGKTNVWDHDVGIASAPLMSEVELRAWVAGGQEVGAHTRHHVHLNALPAQQAEIEIADSRAELQAMTNTKVAHFCYPYGEFSADHADMVRSAGYQSATTTFRGRCHHKTDLFQLPRAPVPRSVTRLALWMKLATDYEDKRGP